jgi:hypothetical protein
MPRAYCHRCKQHVNATPSGSEVLGAVFVDNPGAADFIVPIRNRYQAHYCPTCGTSLVTEERISQMDSDTRMAELLFWITAVPLAFVVLGSWVSGTGVGGLVGLGCLLVFGSYISLLFHGNNQLWGTLLVAAIGLLMYFSDTREQEIKDTSRAKKEAAEKQARLEEKDTSRAKKEAAKRQARLEEAEKNRLAEASAEQESREQEKQKELAAIERQKADLVSTPTLKQSSSITEAEAQRKAIQLYPELGIAGSQLNRDFVARYKLYKQTQPTFFRDTSWPLRLVRELTQPPESK